MSSVNFLNSRATTAKFRKPVVQDIWKPVEREAGQRSIAMWKAGRRGYQLWDDYPDWMIPMILHRIIPGSLAKADLVKRLQKIITTHRKMWNLYKDRIARSLLPWLGDCKLSLNRIFWKTFVYYFCFRFRRGSYSIFDFTTLLNDASSFLCVH